MKNLSIILKFKEICDKPFESPDAMMLSHATDVSYKSGVQAVKNDIANLVLELMSEEVVDLVDMDKMPDVEVTKKNVPESVRTFLKLKGYTVYYHEKLKLWQALDPNKDNLIRGGDLTEDGAWYYCYSNYQRNQ